MKRWSWIALGLVGCPDFPPGDICGYPGFCDGSIPDATTTDAGGCDPAADAGCVDDANGVFVSPAGLDSNLGTRASPLKTLGAALNKNKPKVYVCAGAYAETVTITANVDLLGGYACADWSYATTNTATVSPPAGLPLKITNATALVRDLSFVAADGVNPGDSSMGALVVMSTVTFLRDTIQAGKGVSAQQPMAQPDYTPSQADAGAPGTTGSAGGPTSVTCANGTGSTTGGQGGPPAPAGANGSSGSPTSYPVNPASADGAGGSASAGSCSVGHNGSYGPGGDAGASPMKFGTLSASGWAPLGGSSGGSGDVGEGGGGGASSDSTGGGGGGGPGGCGGVGGAGGPGGGGSIAVAALTSTLTFTQTHLLVHDAGDGAPGGKGQKAEGGGARGGFAGNACPGGVGGHGGSGGGGGGGAGGISVGILYTGAAPSIDGMMTTAADTLPSVTLGSPGALGAGGMGGDAYQTSSPASNAGAVGNPGVAGVAKAVMVSP